MLFFVCCREIVQPTGPMSMKRMWFMEQIADIVDAPNRRKMLKSIRKLHVTDQILHVAFDLFPDPDDIIYCVNGYIVQLNVFNEMENRVECVEGNDHVGALQIVLNLSQYLSERQYLDKFRVELVCMEFLTTHIEFGEWQYYSMLFIYTILRKCQHLELGSFSV